MKYLFWIGSLPAFLCIFIMARLKEPDLQSLERFVVSHSLYRSRVFEVSRFVLFSSRPSRGGGPYAVEESYDLQVAQ